MKTGVLEEFDAGIDAADADDPLELSEADVPGGKAPPPPSKAKGKRPATARLDPKAPAGPMLQLKPGSKIPAPPSPTIPNRKDFQFFDYWREIPEDVKPRMVVYIYRTFPLIDREKNGKLNYIGKHTDDYLRDKNELLRIYGSGEYKLIMRSVDLNKPICTCYTSVDDREFPPVVDIEDLIMDHPRNQSYIENLRARRILKPAGEMARDKAEEEDNVAVVEAVNKMADMAQEATQQAIGMAQRAVDAAEARSRQPSAATPPPTIEASSEAMKIVSQAAQMGNALLSSAVTQAERLKAEITGANPIEHLEKTFGLIERLMGKVHAGGGDAATVKMIEGLMEEMKQLRQENASLRDKMIADRIGDLEKRLSEKMNAATAGQGQPGGLAGTSSIAEQVKQLVSIKETLDEHFGGGEGVGAGRRGGTGWPDKLDGWMERGAVIIGGLASMYYNYKASEVQAQPPQGPQPVRPGGGPPAQRPAVPQLQPPPAMSMPGPGRGDGSGAAPEQSRGNAGNGSGLEDFMTRNPYAKMLMTIEDPLLRYLQEGRSGADFGHLFIELRGPQEFEALQHFGKDAVAEILRTYPPIWEVAGAMPAQFAVFLDEFMRTPEILEQKRRERLEKKRRPVAEQQPT